MTAVDQMIGRRFPFAPQELLQHPHPIRRFSAYEAAPRR
jgi:hypothetical protein